MTLERKADSLLTGVEKEQRDLEALLDLQVGVLHSLAKLTSSNFIPFRIRNGIRQDPHRRQAELSLLLSSFSHAADYDKDVTFPLRLCASTRIRTSPSSKTRREEEHCHTHFARRTD